MFCGVKMNYTDSLGSFYRAESSHLGNFLQAKGQLELSFGFGELALPAEGTCFRGNLFGFRDHASLLIEYR